MPKTVRTRFAPSPTGFLHLGGLRTALYNYLFAKHHRGQFVVRLEDTDRSRYVEGAAEQLMSSLKWAGLAYDEGPDMPGEYGPYVQSQRLDIYRKFADQLLQQGDAYRCFCTPEELETMREKQQAAGEATRYDGTWRGRNVSDVQAKLDAGAPFVVRLKMPLDGETTFADIVRGEVSFPNELMDDQVLMKSDGFPTYHLANVVDDHLMEISHIIRGEEWLPSVPKHLQLYKSLGWEAPKMAHLSLLLNPDRSKLSKRQGDVAVEDYMAKGILPEALINYIALLGWNPGGDEEIFSIDEMIKQFELERVSKSGSVFDIEKLFWMNGAYLREISAAKRQAFLIPFLANEGADVSDVEKTARIVEAIAPRIDTGEKAYQAAALFFTDQLQVEDPQALAFLQEESASTVLSALRDHFQTMEKIDAASFKAAMKSIQTEYGIKGPALWKPVRVALTGELSGPEVVTVVEIFGKEKCISFLQQALELAREK